MANKRFGLGMTVMVLSTVLTSCVSLQDREMSVQEKMEANIIGSVSAEFTSFQVFHNRNSGYLQGRAHVELMRVAEQQFHGNIEIRNISIVGTAMPHSFGSVGTWHGGVSHLLLIINSVLAIPVSLFGNIQRIVVVGDVVLHQGSTAVP